MRKAVLSLAIAALLALPGTSFGWTIEIDLVEADSLSSTIDYDPSSGPLEIKVLLTSDYEVTNTAMPPIPSTFGLDGIQFQLICDSSTSDSDWQFDADSTYWQNGSLFADSEVTSNVKLGYPDYGEPYEDLDYINGAGAEVYFKGSGEYVYPVTQGHVATYVLELEDPGSAEVSTIYKFSGIRDDYSKGNTPSQSVGVDCGGYTGGDELWVHIVPEPATALLLLGAVPFLRRRR
jgi:MYXO-CTERM domain-containing protein